MRSGFKCHLTSKRGAFKAATCVFKNGLGPPQIVCDNHLCGLIVATAGPTGIDGKMLFGGVSACLCQAYRFTSARAMPASVLWEACRNDWGLAKALRNAARLSMYKFV